MMREITEQEKAQVLARIGSLVIDKIITECVFYTSEEVTIIKWREAEVWVKKNAKIFTVDEHVLKSILLEQLIKVAEDDLGRRKA